MMAIESPIGYPLRKLKRWLLMSLPMITNIFLSIACVLRSDVLCIVYLVLIGKSLALYRLILISRNAQWRLLNLQIYGVMLTFVVRVLFIFPAGQHLASCPPTCITHDCFS